ncbi:MULTISPECIES: serine/threonine-protein kinase [unclassified Mycobacterium]|uniref:serine/threonine-protein kinase n=1 Tax=unclassified Mycobacterium TaxID=2642494 RepID=UPI0009EB4831|nr:MULTISPECIES: serine/threonine-protein kinase [unclassified Mycobacterium]
MSAPEVFGGRYELRGALGSGGMAVVRDGWDTRLDRAVAVKVLHPGMLADTATRRRFVEEARAAAALNHPNIVAVHDSGEHNGTPYIVMERLPGNSLADAIAQGPLPQPLVRRVLNEVLGALSAAHDAGILHRDIKPANILFTPSGLTKLSDFGIAKSAGVDLTTDGQIVGTMAYLSPNRIAGEAATVADDVYSVGVVGYEALTGRRPFDQENVAALARAILDHRAPPVTALRPDADPALAAVVAQAMHPDRARRFGSARQMRAALNGFGAPVGAPLRPPTAVMTSPVPPATYMPHAAGDSGWKPPSRKQTRIGVAAVAAVLALAAVLLMINSPFDAPQPASTPTSTAPPSPPPAPGTTTAPPTPSTPPLTEEELKKREEQQKKLEEQQKKREEEQKKREEEQRKRAEEQGR